METKNETIQKNNEDTLLEFLKDKKYFPAIGRRKTTSCSARLYVNNFPKEINKIFILINQRNYKDYFNDLELQKIVEAPFKILELGDKNFFVSLKVRGGGLRGQAEASRLAISRALVKFDEKLKPKLKNMGFLKRDPRAVERKKWGKLKSRKSPQWQKR